MRRIIVSAFLSGSLIVGNAGAVEIERVQFPSGNATLGYAALAAAGRAARTAYEREGKIVTRAAVSDGSTPAAMPVQAAVDYYMDRAASDGWRNRWTDMCYDAILSFESIPDAHDMRIPALVVHADNAISPEAARRHFKAVGASEERLVWLEAADHFQFYDAPEVVGRAADEVAAWFDRGSADDAKLQTIVRAVGAYADRGEFELLEPLFADRVTLDYTSLWGGEPASMSARELVTSWGALLPGFDATVHEISGIETRISDDEASAEAHVAATHWLDGRRWIVSGRYHYRFRCENNGWQISSLTFSLYEEIGNRGLVDLAAARANVGEENGR